MRKFTCFERGSFNKVSHKFYCCKFKVDIRESLNHITAHIKKTHIRCRSAFFLPLSCLTVSLHINTYHFTWHLSLVIWVGVFFEWVLLSETLPEVSLIYNPVAFKPKATMHVPLFHFYLLWITVISKAEGHVSAPLHSPSCSYSIAMHANQVHVVLSSWRTLKKVALADSL